MSEANKGKTLSDETRSKLSESLKGEKHPLFGKHPSEETRSKLSDAKKGNTYSLGHHHSDESKKKMSEARKAYWEKRKMSKE